MKKWGRGCLGIFASTVILVMAFFLLFPAPLLPIFAVSGRVSGLADVKRTFPQESFSWLDLFQSYHVFSWDGTTIAAR